MKPEISVIIPAYNEGSSVESFLNDLVLQLEKLKKEWEVIFIDNNTVDSSEETVKKFTSKYNNFFGYQIFHPGVAVADKANKYMLGFELARGKYIFHLDADGQDRPEELQKFINKLDEGFDLVVGLKKKRKDTFLYKFTSWGVNTIVRFLTGVQVHDMNNGFKGYRATAAKSLKLKGGNFRFIPILLAAKGMKITEVPVEHRERTYGEGKFSFLSRLKGGIFDLLSVIISTRISFLHAKEESEISYKDLILKQY